MRQWDPLPEMEEHRGLSVPSATRLYLPGGGTSPSVGWPVTLQPEQRLESLRVTILVPLRDFQVAVRGSADSDLATATWHVLDEWTAPQGLVTTRTVRLPGLSWAQVTLAHGQASALPVDVNVFGLSDPWSAGGGAL